MFRVYRRSYLVWSPVIVGLVRLSSFIFRCDQQVRWLSPGFFNFYSHDSSFSTYLSCLCWSWWCWSRCLVVVAVVDHPRPSPSTVRFLSFTGLQGRTVQLHARQAGAPLSLILPRKGESGLVINTRMLGCSIGIVNSLLRVFLLMLRVLSRSELTVWLHPAFGETVFNRLLRGTIVDRTKYC